jgi:hypothetical protein
MQRAEHTKETGNRIPDRETFTQKGRNSNAALKNLQRTWGSFL